MRRLRDGGARENKRYRFVAEGGSNRREEGLSTHWRKDTLVWNAKERNTRREDRGRESNRRRSDEDSPGAAGEEQHGMENEGEKAGGKASDETNEIGWTKKATRPAREGREALRS